MNGPNEYKEVRFDLYCEKCEHKDEPVDGTWENVCGRCLDEPVNLHSVKPVNFKEKEK